VGGEKLLLHQSDDGETALHVATSQDHEEVRHIHTDSMP
jgi:hypothetical protein